MGAKNISGQRRLGATSLGWCTKRQQPLLLPVYASSGGKTYREEGLEKALMMLLCAVKVPVNFDKFEAYTLGSLLSTLYGQTTLRVLIFVLVPYFGSQHTHYTSPGGELTV